MSDKIVNTFSYISITFFFQISLLFRDYLHFKVKQDL